MTVPSLLVVVPTRNRGELASQAVESVITAAGDDVTVLVSDNSSEPDEVERVAGFCRRLDDPRVAYIRPPQSMSMVDHWNWALSNALERDSVTHVSYLSDRMVFRPDGLRGLLDVLQRNPAAVVTFNFDSVDDRVEPVRLFQNPWSGREIPISSRLLLDLAAGADVLHRPTPRMLNTAVPVAVLHHMRRQFGEVFGSLAPDYCFAYRCLSIVDSIVYYDRPCIIEHSLRKSHGSNVMWGRRTAERADFRSLTGPEGLNFAAPIPGLDTGLNAVYHEYCFVRSEVGGDKLKPLATQPYLERLVAEVAGFEDPLLRAAAVRILEEHGWKGPVDGSGAAARTSRLRGAATRPREMVHQARRLGASRILGHSVTKPVWLWLARWGVPPPREQRFTFGSVQEALDYANRFPRPPFDDLTHLGPLVPPGAGGLQSFPANDRTSDGTSSSTQAGR